MASHTVTHPDHTSDLQNGQTVSVDLPKRLGVLAEMIRLRMLAVLVQHELAVGELCQVLQQPQSTVSRHLKQLSDDGWLTRRQVRTAAYYRMHADDLDPAARTLWNTVRAMLSPSIIEDDEHRVQGVLSERSQDSLAFFGRFAGEWDQIRSELFGDRLTESALLGFVDPTWTVVDIGCGTGNAAEALAPLVTQVVAIDATEEMLAGARKRLSDHENIRFVHADADDLPLEADSVDAVVMSLLLHHLDQPEAVLAEAARVLRPDGLALIVDMLPHDREDYRDAMGHRWLGFETEQIHRWLADAGFAHPTVRRLGAAGVAKGPGLFVARGTKIADPAFRQSHDAPASHAQPDQD